MPILTDQDRKDRVQTAATVALGNYCELLDVAMNEMDNRLRAGEDLPNGWIRDEIAKTRTPRRYFDLKQNREWLQGFINTRIDLFTTRYNKRSA